MPEIKMPEPQSWERFHIIDISGKRVTIELGGALVLFFDTVPVALKERNVCYFPDLKLDGPAVRAIRDFAGDALQQRSEPATFDFVLAQAFITTAMPWTKRRTEGM